MSQQQNQYTGKRVLTQEQNVLVLEKVRDLGLTFAEVIHALERHPSMDKRAARTSNQLQETWEQT